MRAVSRSARSSSRTRANAPAEARLVVVHEVRVVVLVVAPGLLRVVDALRRAHARASKAARDGGGTDAEEPRSPPHPRWRTPPATQRTPTLASSRPPSAPGRAPRRCRPPSSCPLFQVTSTTTTTRGRTRRQDADCRRDNHNMHASWRGGSPRARPWSTSSVAPCSLHGAPPARRHGCGGWGACSCRRRTLLFRGRGPSPCSFCCGGPRGCRCRGSCTRRRRRPWPRCPRSSR